MIKGPQADAIKQALQSTAVVFVASITRVETAMVMLGRMGWDRQRFDRDWQGLGLQEGPLVSPVAGLAIDASRRSAAAPAKATPDFSDAIADALAASRDIPPLFKTDDVTANNPERAYAMELAPIKNARPDA